MPGSETTTVELDVGGMLVVDALGIDELVVLEVDEVVGEIVVEVGVPN